MYKTSSKWEHQVTVYEDGFKWDGISYRYDAVRSIRGVPIQHYVNFSPVNSQFVFSLFLDTGIILTQQVGSGGRFKLAMRMNDEEVHSEISHLFGVFQLKTYNFRIKKYNSYYEKHKRVLLQDDGKGNTVSSDQEGNIFFNEKYFGSWFPSENSLETSLDLQTQEICFKKINSNFLSKDRKLFVDTFLDHDIISEAFEFIHLPLSSFK